jgi:hypothetical protein
VAKKAKQLAIQTRHIYKTEIEHCPHCQERLERQRHYQWRKTVQQLEGAVFVASHASECQNPGCEYQGRVYVPVKAQRVTLPGCSYGLDIIAQIGWWRQKEHLERSQIHQCLRATGVQISEREVDYLYERYEILLGCVEQLKVSDLAKIVQEYGGLVIDLDGLAPEGANEQLWVVREALSGVVLVAAWLPRVDHTALIEVLAPVKALQLPILGTVSDKQPCVKKAVEIVWPEAPHQWCQAHYLRNAMDSVYEQDRLLKTAMGKEIRTAIRPIVAEVLQDNDQNDTAPQLVTGALVDVVDVVDERLPTPSQHSRPQRSQVVSDLVSDIKQALLRKGRAPFDLAGVPMLDDLMALQTTLARCLQLVEDPHLRGLHTTLDNILPQYSQAFAEVATTQAWVETIADILDKPLPTTEEPGVGGDAVALEVAHYLGTLAHQPTLTPWQQSFRNNLFALTDRYWSGLFHCYDIVGLPRTNNDLEGLFGQTKRQLRRRLGVSQLREPLLRHGAWAILRPSVSSPEKLAHQFAQIECPHFCRERTRYDQRQVRFRRRYQWRQQRDSVLQHRFTDWANAVSVC